MVQTYATKSKLGRFARHGKNLGSSQGEKSQGFGLLAKICIHLKGTDKVKINLSCIHLHEIKVTSIL